MTDPPHHPDRELLVRAYVDGELDEAARAELERDPVLVAEAAAHEDVRRLLRASDPPDVERRERAIAAALAAFDEASAASRAAGAVAAPVSLATRRPARWLVPAAAALAVIVGGAVIAGVTGDSDEDQASEMAEDATADAETADTMGAAEATLRVLADDDASEEASTSAAGATEAAADATLPRLSSPEDLAVLAREWLGAGTAEATGAPETDGTAAAPAAAPAACADDVMGEAELDIGGVVRAVVVRLDEATGDAVALDAMTCAEVLRAPLP